MIAYLVRNFAGAMAGGFIGYMIVCCLPFLQPYYDGVIPLFMSVGAAVCTLRKHRFNLLWAIGVNYVFTSLWCMAFLVGVGMCSIPIACRRLLVYNVDVGFALYTIFLMKHAVRTFFDGMKEDKAADNGDI